MGADDAVCLDWGVVGGGDFVGGGWAEAEILERKDGGGRGGGFMR